MDLNSWPGLIAVVLAILSFYVTTYVVIALNTGWRFGYWLTSATFGALMVLLSIFWIVNTSPDNPVGPHGEEPRWITMTASRDRIATASLEEQRFSSPAQYPSGPWRPAGEENAEQQDELSSAVTNCLSTNPERLPPDEREQCEAAQKLMPPEEDIPVIEGTAVAVTPEVSEVRFAEENGALLGQVTVEPITHDPRVARNAERGQALGEPFQLVAVFDKGSIPVPGYASLGIFVLYTAFHLFGLHRAEQRKLSPVAS